MFLRDVAPELQAGVVLRASNFMHSYLHTLSMPRLGHTLSQMYQV